MSATLNDDVLVLAGACTFPPEGKSAVVVEAGCGQRLPFRARAYLAGAYVGATGSCKTADAARQAGMELLSNARRAAGKTAK